MSARPGLCGGHRATGVPTAIASYSFWALAKHLARPLAVRVPTVCQFAKRVGSISR